MLLYLTGIRTCNLCLYPDFSPIPNLSDSSPARVPKTYWSHRSKTKENRDVTVFNWGSNPQPLFCIPSSVRSLNHSATPQTRVSKTTVIRYTNIELKHRSFGLVSWCFEPSQPQSRAQKRSCTRIWTTLNNNVFPWEREKKKHAKKQQQKKQKDQWERNRSKTSADISCTCSKLMDVVSMAGRRQQQNKQTNKKGRPLCAHRKTWRVHEMYSWTYCIISLRGLSRNRTWPYQEWKLMYSVTCDYVSCYFNKLEH